MMPLLASVLSSGLGTVFAGMDDFSASGDSWASAYATYAQAATAAGSIPVFTGLERSVLGTALSAAFSGGVASQGSSTLSAIEAAFIAFWMTPPVAFGIGVVTVAPPGLSALLAAPAAAAVSVETTSTAASLYASVLDAWTHTVMVTFPNGATAALL